MGTTLAPRRSATKGVAWLLLLLLLVMNPSGGVASWVCTGSGYDTECVMGRCKNHKCYCDDDWEGALCNCRPDVTCHGHGWCTSAGSCDCEYEWFGTGCTISCTIQTCSNHGYCDAGGGCECDEDWHGEHCSVRRHCDCLGHGECDSDGFCHCFGDYEGEMCACSPSSSCSSHGSCLPSGECACFTGFTGSTCSDISPTPQPTASPTTAGPTAAPSIAPTRAPTWRDGHCTDCSSHGFCHDNGDCTCDYPYGGLQCDADLRIVCALLSSCEACSLGEQCQWNAGHADDLPLFNDTSACTPRNVSGAPQTFASGGDGECPPSAEGGGHRQFAVLVGFCVLGLLLVVFGVFLSIALYQRWRNWKDRQNSQKFLQDWGSLQGSTTLKTREEQYVYLDQDDDIY